ncbi:O-antigen ligase family protein [Rhodohalobacter sp. 8-1]|uniref:O-antigen ligase family protein n=1 Tax=Rhodohalobacter sp. 8-1 TaxID=3131972 RepID=UPI0030EDB664
MQKIIIGLLLGFLIFAPYLNIPDYNFYDNKRLLQLCIMGGISLVILFASYFKRGNLSKKNFVVVSDSSKYFFVAVLFLFSVGSISVLLSERFEYALLEFAFLFLLISLLFILTPINQKNHLFLGKIIIASAILYSVSYLMLFFGNYISSFFNPMITLWPGKYDFSIIINGIELQGKETLFFTHKRFFNHTQTWTIPILVGIICYHRNKFSTQWVISALLLLLTSFWWMLIFASGGRGSVLSLILSIFVLTIIWRKDLIPFLKYGSVSLAAGAIFYFIFFKLIPNSNGNMPLLRSSDSGRLNMWQGAMESWWQNPLFGIGPMHYSQIETAPFFAHPHNFYIQFITEWGSIAFIALAFLIGFLIKNVLNNYPKENQKFQSKFLYISVSWALSAALIHAFFSGVFHTPMSQIWFVLMVAWLLGYNRTKTTVIKNFANQRLASIVYVVLILVVVGLVHDDIATIYQGYENYLSKYPESKFYPRFWGQGLFE